MNTVPVTDGTVATLERQSPLITLFVEGQDLRQDHLHFDLSACVSRIRRWVALHVLSLRPFQGVSPTKIPVT
jgi:hypothetical protein